MFSVVTFILRKFFVGFGYVVSCFANKELIVGAVDFIFKVVDCAALRFVIFVDDGVIELFNEDICVFVKKVALRVDAKVCCCICIGVVFISLGLNETNLGDSDAILVVVATVVIGR